MSVCPTHQFQMLVVRCLLQSRGHNEEVLSSLEAKPSANGDTTTANRGPEIEQSLLLT